MCARSPAQIAAEAPFPWRGLIIFVQNCIWGERSANKLPAADQAGRNAFINVSAWKIHTQDGVTGSRTWQHQFACPRRRATHPLRRDVDKPDAQLGNRAAKLVVRKYYKTCFHSLHFVLQDTTVRFSFLCKNVGVRGGDMEERAGG